jgi:uncharacterized delta-60 repeat protein
VFSFVFGQKVGEAYQIPGVPVASTGVPPKYLLWDKRRVLVVNEKGQVWAHNVGKKVSKSYKLLGAPVGFLAVGTAFMSLEDQNKLLSLTPGTVVQYTNLFHTGFSNSYSGSFTVAQPSVPGDTDRINIYINVGGFLPEIGSAINSNFFAVNINFTWTGDITTGTIVNALSVSIDTVAINGTLTVNGQPLSETDLSEVTEDILPLFSEVYDIGSADKRWYDLYLANNLDITGATLTGAEGVLSTTADVVVGSLLSDQLLLSDNMITPDDSTAREYLGDKGIVIVNGNMDVQGDWLGAPVVQSLEEIIASIAGELDPAFNIGIGFDSIVISVAIQEDGKILVGGTFTAYDGVSQSRISRLNPDGSRDTSFNIGSGFNSNVNSITVQSDGKILVGGYFTNYNGVTQNFIARLNSDGSLDFGFNTGGGFNNAARSIVLQEDGKIVVVGYFISYNGGSQNYIARLNPDGTLDTSFNIGTGFNAALETIAIQSDGKFVVGGYFISYNGVLQRRIARLIAETIVGQPASTPSTTGEEGIIRYNKDITAFEGHNGTEWNAIVSADQPLDLILSSESEGPVDATTPVRYAKVIFAGQTYYMPLFQ